MWFLMSIQLRFNAARHWKTVFEEHFTGTYFGRTITGINLKDSHLLGNSRLYTTRSIVAGNDTILDIDPIITPHHNMPSTPADLTSAALIAQTYHIVVKVLSKDKYFSNIRAIETPIPPIVRQSRPTLTATSDFMHRHFTPRQGLNFRQRFRSEYDIINSNEEEMIAQDTRNLVAKYRIRKKHQRWQKSHVLRRVSLVSHCSIHSSDVTLTKAKVMPACKRSVGFKKRSTSRSSAVGAAMYASPNCVYRKAHK